MKVTCKEDLLKAITEYPTDSNCPWQKGVKFYAEWLVENINDYSMPITEKYYFVVLRIGNSIHGVVWRFVIMVIFVKLLLLLMSKKEQNMVYILQIPLKSGWTLKLVHCFKRLE